MKKRGDDDKVLLEGKKLRTMATLISKAFDNNCS